MHFDKSLVDKMTKLKHIPTLPHILLKLIKTCNAERGSLKEISSIIEKDPALTGRVLSLVNSAYYSKNSSIRNVDGAVIFLGTNAIKNIAICSSVHEVFHNVKSGAGFNLKHFWWHSLRCAILAKSIAKNRKFRDPEEAFLFGMLHDIGKIILWVNFPEKYADLLEKRKGRPDLILAGEAQLGADHAEIGAWLLNKWNFQHEIVDAVLSHHHSTYSMLTAPPLAQFIFSANLLSSDSGEKITEGFSAAEKFFGFSQSDAENFMHQADDELKIMAESLNIEVEPFKSTDFEYTDYDREKEMHLSKEVWERSLLLNTVQNLLGATDEQTIWNETAQGLQILFEVTSILFFDFDPEISGLRGVTLADAAKSEKIKDMIVPMAQEDSLLIECLRSRKIASSFARSKSPWPSGPDKEILSILDKEGLCCIPMTAYGETIGVVVLGLDAMEMASLQHQFKLLQMLADQAAIAIRVHHLGNSRLQQIKFKRVKASASADKHPFSVIKKYFKMPWASETAK